MHRRLQFGMRENTASSRQHAPRSESLSAFTTGSEHTNAATVARDDDQLLTVQQVAELLHVPVSWVYGRTRKRSTERLPGIRLGQYWRFREDVIYAWVESQRGGHRAA